MEKVIPGRWVNVGFFRGKVVRVRNFQGETYIDVEIDGVITGYTLDQITVEEI